MILKTIISSPLTAYNFIELLTLPQNRNKQSHMYLHSAEYSSIHLQRPVKEKLQSWVYSHDWIVECRAIFNRYSGTTCMCSFHSKALFSCHRTNCDHKYPGTMRKDFSWCWTVLNCTCLLLHECGDEWMWAASEAGSGLPLNNPEPQVHSQCTASCSQNFSVFTPMWWRQNTDGDGVYIGSSWAYGQKSTFCWLFLIYVDTFCC